MLTTEQLLKIEQDVREFNESTLSGMCLPITGEDATELVKMARRYLWLRDEERAHWDNHIFVTPDGHKDVYAPNIICGEKLDRAIDSAINSQRKEGGEG